MGMQNNAKKVVTLNTLDYKTQQLRDKIDSAEETLLEKIDGVESRLDGVENKINEIEKKLDRKIDDLEDRLTTKLDKILEVVVDKQGSVNYRLTLLEHHTSHPPRLATTN